MLQDDFAGLQLGQPRNPLEFGALLATERFGFGVELLDLTFTLLDLAFTTFDAFDFAVEDFFFATEPFFLLANRQTGFTDLRFGFGANPQCFVGCLDFEFFVLGADRFDLELPFGV